VAGAFRVPRPARGAGALTLLAAAAGVAELAREGWLRRRR
jgi:hypothetical protein